MLTCVIVVCVYVRITWATCLTFALGASDMAVTCHFLAMLSKEKIRRCCEANKLGWTRPTIGHADTHIRSTHCCDLGPQPQISCLWTDTASERGSDWMCSEDCAFHSCSKLHPKAMSYSVVCRTVPRDTCNNASVELAGFLMQLSQPCCVYCLIAI